ncbi:hypothetical protein [Oryzomonas rubra]|uniref:Uncharacterized protein n=1 Tax=Oryzomonas rubra TaxID=2509454 RepID=A0A5A9XEI5_9BACT|nr:hypothetical protein [Oryzomonas rubra]KAA0891330.1 hypothetical protein ET418_11135 [Oryzomonas rubra]
MILLPLSKAFAEPRGLLLLGDLQQSLGVTYDYRGRQSSVNSQGTYTASHQLEEKYHFDIDYGVLDRNWLNGTFSSDVSLEQREFNDSGNTSKTASTSKYQYNLTGVVLNRSPYPISFHSRRELSTIHEAYTPGYDLDTNNNGVRLNLLNNFLTTSISYEKNSTETSGLTHDSKNTQDGLNLQVANQFRDTSTTQLNANYYSERTDFKDSTPQYTSKNYDVGLMNSINFGGRQKHSLASTLQFSESRAAGIPSRRFDWTESLHLVPGKALKIDMTYWNSSSKTLNSRGSSQIDKSNTGNIAVTHRLFQSLETRLFARFRQSDFATGQENVYAGSFGFTYSKILPKTSTMRIGYSREYGITDRKGTESLSTVRDESHTVALYGEIISLNTSGAVDPLSISIRSASISSPFHTLPYNEGPLADYTVDTLGRVTITPGSQIRPGDTVLISYDVLLNPNVKYATTNQNIFSSLSLFSNRYRLSGSLFTVDQQLLSGNADSASLANQRTAVVRLETDRGDNTFSLEYDSTEQSNITYSYVEGTWRYNHRFQTLTLGLYARDRYVMHDAVTTASSHSAAYAENIIDTGATYQQPLFRVAMLGVTLNYLKSTGGTLERDLIYFKTTLRARFNKLLFSLTSQVNWNITGSMSTRDDIVRFELTRFF